MAKFTRAVEFGKEFIKNHPKHKEQVLDLFQLMKDECEDECTSVENEISLFIGACDDLLIEDEE